MRIFPGLEEFAEAKGEHLGHSNWHTVDQNQIDRFAAVTGDQQWIHVDPAAAANGPYGTTVAHGYLTLSLLPLLGRQIYRVEGIAMAINYGTQKVRFPAPVPAGSRIRAGVELVEVSDVPGGKHAVLRYTVEIEDGDRPVCVAELVARFMR